MFFGALTMADSLGWRQKFAVLVPSTNTSVQPEFDAMRPAGVTNHISRINIPNISLVNDEDFSRLIQLIAAAQNDAVDAVMSCEPDRIVLGISAETFWDGLQASRRLKQELEQRTRLPVVMGSEACQAALSLLGAKKIGVITPYQPVGDANVSYFSGTTATEARPQTILAGAANVLGGGGGLDPSWSVFLGTSIDAAWDQTLHVRSGLLALSDGSVRITKTVNLREQISSCLAVGQTNVVFSKPRGVF